MRASILPSTLILVLFMSLVSGSVVRRQNKFASNGTMHNLALGTVWTMLWPHNSSAGNLVVISPTANLTTQLFTQFGITYPNGTTIYTYYSVDSQAWLSFTQYTSSYNYARGYGILQTGPSQANAASFYALPGSSNNSVYLQWTTVPLAGTQQVSFYWYDSPNDPQIPVIHDALNPNQDENQSWIWVPL